MGGLLSRRKKPPGRKSRHQKHSSHPMHNDIFEIEVEDRQNSISMISVNSPERQPKLLISQTLLDTPNFDVRIQAAEKEGNQISKTHYFLLEEPRYRRCNSSKERCNPIEMYANSSRLFNQSGEEPLLPFDMNLHITQNHNSLPIRRGKSDTTDYLYNHKRALIARMRMTIPQATDIESEGVLVGTNWNYPEAERRLKKEMVHRYIGRNYKQCEALLMEHDWDLECALTSFLEDRKNSLT